MFYGLKIREIELNHMFYRANTIAGFIILDHTQTFFNSYYIKARKARQCFGPGPAPMNKEQGWQNPAQKKITRPGVKIFNLFRHGPAGQKKKWWNYVSRF